MVGSIESVNRNARYSEKNYDGLTSGTMKMKEKQPSENTSIFFDRKKSGWLTLVRIRERNSLKILKVTGFFKKLGRKDERIPIEMKKSIITLKVSILRVWSQICFSDKNVNDELNKAFTENEVIKFMKKMNNGKLAGLGNIYQEFIKNSPDS